MSLQFGDDTCSQVVTPSTVGELLVVVARSSKVAATGSHSCSPRLCRWETGEKNKTQTPWRRKYIWSDSHIAALRDVVDGKLGRETFSSGCCCLFQPPNFCRAMIKCQINHWHCHLTVSIGRTGKWRPKLWATTFETQAACLWAICCLSYMFSPSTMYLIYRKSVQIKIHKYTSTQVTNTQIYKDKGVLYIDHQLLHLIQLYPTCQIVPSPESRYWNWYIGHKARKEGQV